MFALADIYDLALELIAMAFVGAAYFWERLRERILDKNNFGVAPNDAGPLWMGLRLISPRSENAYQNVTYPKGAYVLQMLRSMMYTNDDQDKDFIAEMENLHETVFPLTGEEASRIYAEMRNVPQNILAEARKIYE